MRSHDALGSARFGLRQHFAPQLRVALARTPILRTSVLMNKRRVQHK
jgi:hypothetical protein